jgi:hypothetical protein
LITFTRRDDQILFILTAFIRIAFFALYSALDRTVSFFFSGADATGKRLDVEDGGVILFIVGTIGAGVMSVGSTGVGVTGVGLIGVGVTGVGVTAVGVTGAGDTDVGVTAVGVTAVAVTVTEVAAVEVTDTGATMLGEPVD